MAKSVNLSMDVEYFARTLLSPPDRDLVVDFLETDAGRQRLFDAYVAEVLEPRGRSSLAGSDFFFVKPVTISSCRENANAPS